MRTSPARERLLSAAVNHALSAGIADLSLRELAAAIGTSHRMLLYHFGSREGLLVAVARAVEQRQRDTLLASGSLIDPWQSWRRISDPALWPSERLFFELYSYALLGRAGTEEFLDGIVESWVGPVSAALVRAGADEREARADARLGVAVVRGLLLDLLATGDRAAVDEAFGRFVARMNLAPTSPACTGPAPNEHSPHKERQPEDRADQPPHTI